LRLMHSLIGESFEVRIRIIVALRFGLHCDFQGCDHKPNLSAAMIQILSAVRFWIGEPITSL
jgi:hypothetical protein